MKWFKETTIKIDAACPVDESLSILEDLRDKGYETCIFDAQPGSCSTCRSHNREQKGIDEVIDETEHDAPCYTWGGHCGCTCFIIIMGPGLPNVRVSRDGIY